MRVLHLTLAALMGCGFQISATGGGGSDGGGSEPTVGCDPTWFDGAWHARATITIDHTRVAGDLAEFPVLIDLTIAGAQPSGADIVFTAADGRTRLSHELESFDASSGRMLAWVRIPSLSASTDTVLRVYYANPTAADQANAPGVWTGGYSGVWHLRESPAGAAPQIADSTGNGLAATSRGAMSAAAQGPGKIGGSVDFDGTNDGLDVPSFTIGTSFSYEVWFRKRVGSGWRCLLDNAGYDRWFGINDNQLSFWDGTANVVTGTFNVNTWYHLLATYDGANVRIYRNGAQVMNPIPKSYSARTGGLLIAYTNTTVGEYFPGKLDEVRVSTVARSAAYALTAFQNQDAPATFYAVDAPERCP